MNPRFTLPQIPASYFGIVLGLCGLANSWRAAHDLWPLPAAIGEALAAAATVASAILLLFYALGWLFARERALAELRHPIQCCFIGLIGVTTMLVSGALLPYARPAAWVLFTAGATYTLAFGVWRTGNLWKGGRDPSQTTAVLYLPIGAGNFVTAIQVSALGHPEWGALFFGAGLFGWLAIESVLLHRLYTGPELPPALRPTMGIQLAPPAVGLTAYLATTRGAPDPMAYALFGYALLQALLLLRLLPWFWKQPFTPGYWAFTFGTAAVGTGAIRLVQRGDTGPAATLAPWLLGAETIVIGLIALGTLWLLARRRFLPAPPVTVLQETKAA
jgi:tellurite resistance protein